MDVAGPLQRPAPSSLPAEGVFGIADRAFRAMAEGLPLLVWTASSSGDLLFANDRWFEYLESMTGDRARLRYAMHPDDVADTLASWQHALETGERFNQVMRLRRRDGDYRWHRAVAVPLRGDDGSIERWYGVTIDIHDEPIARDAADTDVETRIVREVTRNTPVLMYLMDPRGEITFVNERWAQFTGYPTRELLGRGIANIVHPLDLKRIAAEFFERARHENEVVLRYRIKHADGRYRWIETRSVPERDERGEIVRWSGVGLDMDEHMRATQTLEFLLASGAALAKPSDAVELMEGLAAQMTSGLADYCSVDLQLDGVEPHRIDINCPKKRGPEIRASICDGVDAFGSITVGRLKPGERFEAADMRVLEDVGRRAGLAIAKMRANEATQRESLDRLEQYRRIADFSPQLMWTADAQGRIDWLNRQWYEYTGQTPEEAIDGVGGAARPTHDDDHDRAVAMWQRAVETGEPYEVEVRVRRWDGAYRWCIARANPERDASGRIVRWYGTTIDIHDSRRASRTIGVFAELGERLSESAALDETMDAVLGVVVPEFADSALIALLDDEGEFIVRAVHDRNPSRKAILQTLLGTTHVGSGSTVGSRAAYATGKPFVINDGLEEMHKSALTPHAAAIAHRLGIRCVAVLPLASSIGVVVGTLIVTMADSGRRFDDADIPFYMELARRVTPAIANAELYERERRVAHSFQEAALPARLPRVAGYEFDAVYEAGRAEALVGGDWFDAFTLLDGRIVISIGDVAGAGLRAAVMMSNVRQAIRGVAQVHADPALMLEAADGAIRSQHPETYVTAFVGVIEPMTNVLVYQSAGHPRPLLTLPEGGVIELEGGGLPLGLRSEHEPVTCTFQLPVGSMLTLYTDGLTEATHSLDEGYTKLFATLVQPRLRLATSPAKAIYDAMLPDGSKDDVAILTVRVGEATRGQMFPIVSAHDERDVRGMQKHLLQALRDGGLSENAMLSAELILAEVIGNLARYAPGPAVFNLAWNEGVPVLHVMDSGPGYEFAAKLPADPLSETGRGLFLIASLARNFVVAPRLGGGSHSRIVFKK